MTKKVKQWILSDNNKSMKLASTGYNLSPFIPDLSFWPDHYAQADWVDFDEFELAYRRVIQARLDEAFVQARALRIKTFT